MPPGGTALGYEVLGYDGLAFHGISWRVSFEVGEDGGNVDEANGW